MKNKFLFACLLALSACHSQLQVKDSQTKNLRMKGDSIGLADSKVIEMISPYKLALDSQMNIRIMVASEDLKKDQPEGSLGNMVCDVLMRYAKEKGAKPDFCVLNNGGLRIPTIYKGDIFVRTIYELMPFDNQLVMLKVKGSKCVELFDLIAQSNGVPVSGLQMTIVDGKPTQIKVQQKDFDINKDYWILTSDYLANGGDKAYALKDPPEWKDLSIKIRDVLIVQLKEMFYNGETLQAIKDGRITKN